MIKLLFVFMILSSSTEAKRINKERFYQDQWCKAVSGLVEYRLPDSTRVDCLTETNAIEFDFANKWAEAVGQSLHYSRMTGKQAGIALIMENKKRDAKYLKILQDLVKSYKLNIKIWIIEP